VKDAAEAAAVTGFDVVPLMLSSGYLAACVQVLETFEAERGPTPDTNVSTRPAYLHSWL
jgi:hypothetical protein